MIKYRYILEPYQGIGTRHDCPNCGHEKTFTRYIDTATNQHVNASVGMCNRANNCGYHYPPREYFKDNSITPPAGAQVVHDTVPKPTSFIDNDLYLASRKFYKENHFYSYLQKLFGNFKAKMLATQYRIGTANYWDGATIFWQMDISGRLRTGKIMLYNPDTGKRVKEPHNHVTWVHSVLKLQDFNLSQCFFGEHLALGRREKRPIAVVESEKTAIIASAYLPQMVWVAAGSLTNLTLERCKVFKGKSLVLFPDLRCLDRWKAKAQELSKIAKVSVSDLLETRASDEEKVQGLDLADYLINYK